MVNVSSFLWTSAGQKADGITPMLSLRHTHTRGGRQPCRLVPYHLSRLAPEEFRAITQQVGLPIGVMTVGAMTVGVLTVGSMGRPPSIIHNSLFILCTVLISSWNSQSLDSNIHSLID